jgi:hypothetical protein
VTVDEESRGAANRAFTGCICRKVIGIINVIQNELLVLVTGHTLFEDIDLQPDVAGKSIVGFLIENDAFLVVQGRVLIEQGVVIFPVGFLIAGAQCGFCRRKCVLVKGERIVPINKPDLSFIGFQKRLIDLCVPAVAVRALIVTEFNDHNRRIGGTQAGEPCRFNVIEARFRGRGNCSLYKNRGGLGIVSPHHIAKENTGSECQHSKHRVEMGALEDKCLFLTHGWVWKNFLFDDRNIRSFLLSRGHNGIIPLVSLIHLSCYLEDDP